MKKLKLLKESGLSLSKGVDICRANQATAAQLKDTAPSQIKQEPNAVIQRESSKKPKAPKENGKDSKDQLSAECKYCDNKHERKRNKNKNMLFVWKNQLFCSKVFQEYTRI